MSRMKASDRDLFHAAIMVVVTTGAFIGLLCLLFSE